MTLMMNLLMTLMILLLYQQQLVAEPGLLALGLAAAADRDAEVAQEERRQTRCEEADNPVHSGFFYTL